MKTAMNFKISFKDGEIKGDFVATLPEDTKVSEIKEVFLKFLKEKITEVKPEAVSLKIHNIGG